MFICICSHLLHGFSSLSSFSSGSSKKAGEDQKIKDQVAAKSGPCLLDCMELVLSDVDVFSAKKIGIHSSSSNRDGWMYQIQRDVRGNLITLCYCVLFLFCLLERKTIERKRDFEAAD